MVCNGGESEISMNVSDALKRRHSVRAFKPDPVPEAVVREILETAACAPSGGNLQPWRVYALTGAVLAEFKTIVKAKTDAGVMGEPNDYNVYPPNLWEPFRARRRQAGSLRYAAIGVSDKDEAGLKALSLKNYEFFGAPVGLFFCLDRRMGSPQWSDVGMYMLSVMLLAVEHGLDTCPQESWANWPKTVAEYIKLPADHMIFAGMSLGYRDAAHPINNYRTPREPLSGFAELRGF
jgi:nitroreductase